jgi:DNA-3-methyladenine glycosylase
MTRAAVAARHPQVMERDWFDRPAVQVARDLIGSVLIHDAPDGRVAGEITEVEAYQGPEDRAAHSWRGRTPRNDVMFGPPGHLYVYLIYGMHYCANVVCGPGHKPEAVLLRSATLIEGERLARSSRGNVPFSRLAAGPGNLGAAFGIDRSLNGVDLVGGRVRIVAGRRRRYRRTPRIGVAYAGGWAERRLRYVMR